MPRAAKDLQWGRMRPAGRQFDMPGIEFSSNVHLLAEGKHTVLQ